MMADGVGVVTPLGSNGEARCADCNGKRDADVNREESDNIPHPRVVVLSPPWCPGTVATKIPHVTYRYHACFCGCATTPYCRSVRKGRGAHR